MIRIRKTIIKQTQNQRENMSRYEKEKNPVWFIGSDWGYLKKKGGNLLCSKTEREALIVFVRKGKITLSVLNGENKSVQEGQAILIPSFSKYRIKIEEDLFCSYCYFETDSLFALNKSIAELKDAENSINSNYRVLKIRESLDLFLKLQDYYLENKIITPTFSRTKKKELFLLIFSKYSTEETASFLSPLLGESIEFKEKVISNLLEAKTVNDLARLTNYSISGFIKKFQKNFNESPYQWMLKKKVERIKVDLLSGEMSLQEIAYKYDFFPYSNFTLFCKKHIGEIPSKIAKSRKFCQIR